MRVVSKQEVQAAEVASDNTFSAALQASEEGSTVALEREIELHTQTQVCW